MKKRLEASPLDLSAAPGLRISKGGQFKGISLEDAFASLLEHKEACFGHHEILWAGICSWIKRSSNQTSAKKAIAKRTAQFIADAERESTGHIISTLPKAASRKKIVAARSLALSFASVDKRYAPLYRRIYMQIGGMEAVVKAFGAPPSTLNTKKKQARPKWKKAVFKIVSIATALDYHRRELERLPEEYQKRSSKGVAKVANLLSVRPQASNKKISAGLGKSQISSLLSEHGNAMALIYSAYQVSLVEGSILEELMKKKPVLEKVRPGLKQWLAFAAYFRQQVLEPMNGDFDETFAPAGPAPLEQLLPLPDLSEHHIELIRRAFAKPR